MDKAYLRPAGLVYGADARSAIARGDAGRLGGSDWIAFHQIEVVTRATGSIVRRWQAYRDLVGEPALRAIEAPRPPLAGLDLGRPLAMGIVNATPDSFSDGGLTLAAERAIAHGLALAAEGAAILDVGGESTRPGSEAVAEAEELRRIAPVIEGLAAAGHIVSCDTRKSGIMAAAVAAGARIVNDVSALQFDPASPATVAALGCPAMLMHAQGDPKTMQLAPQYDDVALDVFDALEARIAACGAAGIARQAIVADPGIGFGKTFRHNLEVLNQLTLFHSLGVALMVGLSRKGFVGAVTGERTAGKRVHGSVGGAVHAALNGAHILRVHDVKATVEALAMVQAAADPEASGL